MTFSFENFERNVNLEKLGFSLPNVRKTGTTICGVIFKDGVILGADTRSTMGNVVSNKNCDKIHYLADHIYCGGAGTSADTDHVTKMIASELELHRLLTNKKVPIISAVRKIKQHLFQYQGYIGAALIIGGVDSTGPHLLSIAPHGSSSKANFTSMGSGCLAAISVLERGWKENMDLEDAKNLVTSAILAGIMNDLGSGSNVDLCVLTKDNTENIRSYKIGQSAGEKQKSYTYKPKSTCVLSRSIIPIKIENTIVRQFEAEPMEVL